MLRRRDRECGRWNTGMLKHWNTSRWFLEHYPQPELEDITGVNRDPSSGSTATGYWNGVVQIRGCTPFPLSAFWQ